MKIARSTARRLAVACQGLDGRWKLPKGAEGAAQTIERLGYVQIDTIAVVRRAHHHCLWSRRADYDPMMLHELQARRRRVFEYWTHAASYLPIRDYRYCLPRMQAYADSRRTRRFLRDNARLVRHVRSRIRQEGPLGSADFAAPPGRKRGSWWDWKPAKQALETLFNVGELMVAERRNFQRMYDLSERVLPPGVDTAEPAGDELARFRARRLLAGEGVSAVRGWRLRSREAIARAIEELVAAGEAAAVRVEGLDGGPYYALTGVLDAAAKRRSARKRLHILSPFDNLVIWRHRVRKLFDFDCKLECYLPAARRRWGYFCLPILWGEEFIGRLDPKADRGRRTLTVRKLIFEPTFRDYDGVLPPLAEKLRAFAAFNECERVVVEQTRPRKLKGPLTRALS